MDREYLKRVLTYVIVSVIAVGAMIYVGYHMVKSFTTDVETQMAYIDTFSESVTLDAYILRRERVIDAGAEGTVNYLVRNGGKVAVGDKLADICRGGGAGLRERIDDIDALIKTLSEVEAGAAYSSPSDATNIEARIRGLLYSLSGSVAENDITSASRTASAMLAQLNRHAIVTGQISGFADEIKALEAERASLVSQLTDVARTVTSEESAYFFYDIDGYEEAFSFDDIDEVSLDDLYRMMDTTTVTSGDGKIGKMVLDYKWYIAVPTDRGSASYFTEGGNYDVVFGAGGKKLPMRLRSVMTEASGEGRACLLFECSDMPDDFDYTRMQPVTITVNNYSGYKVPLSAVRVMDYDGEDVYGVYILYGNVVTFRRIEIILTQDGYVLCDSTAGIPDEDDGYYDFPIIGEETSAETEPPPVYESIPYLSLYDRVITSARGLYEGKIVAG